MTKPNLTPAQELMLALSERAQARALTQRSKLSAPDGIDRSHSNYLRPPKLARMVHVSKTYIPNPQAKKDPLARPFLAGPGVTYNVGRNAAKRARRAAGLRSRA